MGADGQQNKTDEEEQKCDDGDFRTYPSTYSFVWRGSFKRRIPHRIEKITHDHNYQRPGFKNHRVNPVILPK